MNIKRNEMELKLFKHRVSGYEEGLRKYDKRKKYIGTSLSACMEDMLAGFMPLNNVAAVVSNTRYNSLKDLIKLRDVSLNGEARGTMRHSLTEEPYPVEDWDKVLDHLLLNCVWIQHRITHGEHDRMVETPHPFEKSIRADAWVPVNNKDLLKWVAGVQKLIK